MTPEEKANELVEKFYQIKLYNKHAGENEEIEHAKQCALICVDEIMNCDAIFHANNKETNDEKLYWQKVKEQIESIK